MHASVFVLYLPEDFGCGVGGGGGGWGSGGAKVLCILRHRGFQLILACSWARPAIIVEWECFYFFCFFTFIPVYSLFLSFISSTISFLPFSGR